MMLCLVFVACVVAAGEVGTSLLPMTAQGGCAWESGFSMSGLDDQALAAVVFDDGSGPALYLGGGFISVDGFMVNHIVRWDGTSWSGLVGPGGTGVDGAVHALSVFDDGTGPALYVGGDFTTAGGVTVNHVARWDGSAWSALSASDPVGVSGTVRAMAVYDDGGGPALFAGGEFITAGGVTVNRIARWNGGSSWSGLVGSTATGVDHTVYALEVFDDGSGASLIVGGFFYNAGGSPAGSIAGWDGSTWFELSSGLDLYVVYALEVYDDGSGEALFVAGMFGEAAGITVNNIARWDGASWTALTGATGTGVAGQVYSLAVFDDGSPALYVGGWFDTAGGVTVNNIARWDGDLWSPLAGPAGTGTSSGEYRPSVDAMAVYDDGAGPELYALGDFTAAGGISAERIARWNAVEWSAVGSSGSGLNGAARSFAVYDDGSGPALYVGGQFTFVQGQRVNRIARWDGNAWSALAGPSGIGVSGSIVDMVVFDDGSGPALYATGYFPIAGGVTVNHIARWDGNAWSALTGPSGTGLSDNGSALAVYNDGSGPALFVTGNFQTAGGVTVNAIAKWDGSTWSALTGPSGTGLFGIPAWGLALAVFDDGGGPATALFVGGYFNMAGGVGCINFAKWDGANWSGFQVGEYGISSLGVFDLGDGEALYLGGSFVYAGDVCTNRIARWDGTTWSALSGSYGDGIEGSAVNAIGVFDGGAGAMLIVAGDFDEAGGLPMANIAAWDGSEWEALEDHTGSGLNAAGRALVEHDDGSGPALWVGGDFSMAGGVLSYRMAQWRCQDGFIFADGFESGGTGAWSAVMP